MDDIKKKIVTAQKLQTIIKSMKMMSFVQIGQYNKAAEGMGFYSKNVVDGLRICLFNQNLKDSLSHTSRDKKLYIFVGTDQGLVGNFNQLLIDKEKTLDSGNFAHYILTGKSLNGRFKVKNKVVDNFKMPTHIKMVPKLAEQIVLAIKEKFESGFSEIHMIYNKQSGKSLLETRVDRILPLDQKFLEKIRNKEWESKKLPMVSGDVGDVFNSLVRQYVFVQVYRILCDSLAAEHFNRMILLDRSEKNIEEQIDTMSKKQQEIRQEEITSELLDIVAGRLCEE